MYLNWLVDVESYTNWPIGFDTTSFTNQPAIYQPTSFYQPVATATDVSKKGVG